MISDVWYSRVSIFSLIEVLLNFLEYLRCVLFPKMVISALIGLVLYLCQDFSCLMTGSRFFDVSVIVRVLIFLLLVEKCFQFPFLIEVLYLVDHEG